MRFTNLINEARCRNRLRLKKKKKSINQTHEQTKTTQKRRDFFFLIRLQIMENNQNIKNSTNRVCAAGIF